jgi:hypothetical protein
MSYLTDGFQTQITFYALGTGVSLLAKEKEVQPPGISAGGANDTTTMRNTTWRTMQPKNLKTLTQMSLVFAYDPAIYDQVNSIIGVNGLCRVDFSDGSALEFYGWLDDFTPNPCVEGEQPTANGTVICGNEDASGNEVGPDYQAA